MSTGGASGGSRARRGRPVQDPEGEVNRQAADDAGWSGPTGSSLSKHLSVGVLTLVIVVLFWLSRPGWHWMHAWNRAFADASLMLLFATLAIGPAARLWTSARRWLRWRRELGIWTVVAAFGHVVIVLAGWAEWDPSRLFYSFNLFKRDWALDQGFALGNVLGIVALAYGVVQVATSNDASIRMLGGSGWKWVQQGAYVLYALVALHTAYFLYFHFVSFHRPVPPANWLQIPFLILVAALFALQTVAFFVTVRRRRGLAADKLGAPVGAAAGRAP